ncbi:MAG: AAA family ATPase, partial [Pseudomonadota bacterium]
DTFLEAARNVFKPFTPIKLVEHFQGRVHICDDFVSEIANTGRHVILYGDRGVGKTSFANLSAFWANRDISKQVSISCEESSTFQSIMSSVFRELGINSATTQIETQQQRIKSFSVNLGGSAAGTTKGYGELKTSVPIKPENKIDSDIATHQIKDLGATIIIDEYDRFKSNQTDVSLAETIKRLSDLGSPTKIIIAGVAKNAFDLISKHPSLDRSCALIHIPRMSRHELEQILSYGESQLQSAILPARHPRKLGPLPDQRNFDVRFPFEIRERILDISDGFPFFTHLLALKLCEVYARRQIASRPSQGTFLREDFQEALRESLKHAELSITESYNKAVRDGNSKKPETVRILDGIALSDSIEVPTNDIDYNMRLVHKRSRMSPRQIQGHINALCREGRGQILERVRPGCYKFTDPRMRAYIRLSLQNNHPSLFSGQLDLPFGNHENKEEGITLEERELLTKLYSRIPGYTAESITYSDDFDALHEEFCRQTGKSHSKRSVWRTLQNLRKAGRFRGN